MEPADPARPVPPADPTPVAKLPQWDAVVAGIVSRQRRRSRRALSLVAAVALIAPLASGFAVAKWNRSSERAPETPVAVAAGGAAAPTTAAPTTTTSLVPSVSQPPVEGGIEAELFDQQKFDWLFTEQIGEFSLRFFAVSSTNAFPGGLVGPDGQPWVPQEGCMPRTLDWRSANLARHTRIDLGEGFVPPRAPRPELRYECRPPAAMFGPPVELPPAGEQPKDTAAASKAVDEALIELFDGSQSTEPRVGHVHEPQGVENALASADQREALVRAV